MNNTGYELYLALGNLSGELGFKTYKSLPDLDVDYPFIVINSFNDLSSDNKSFTGNTTNVTIDLWGRLNDQIKLMEMADKLRSYHSIETPHGIYRQRSKTSDLQLLEDDSVPNTKLWHGILTLSFYLQAKKGE